MTKKKYWIFFALLAFAASAAYTVLRNSGHDFDAGQCPECHEQTPVKGRRETLKMKGPIQAICNRCHEISKNAISHPVEIVPDRDMVLPADFPLSPEGKMTCSTCHDIHAGPPPGALFKWNFLRRQVVGVALCSACHADRVIVREERGAGHSQLIGKAHMEFDKTDRRKDGQIDRVSRLCLSCHDGSIGPNATVTKGMWRHSVAISRFDPQGSHPIGVNYGKALRGRGGLHPVSSLNPAIKLIDGKVGCGSCHDPYSKNPNRLVVSNNGSRLCLECHDK